jgi:ribosomal protein S18 acetylase RimI-like enzyme
MDQIPRSGDDATVRDFLEQHGSAVVARRGELVDALARPAIVAQAVDGSVAGVLTYDIAGDECEILTLHVVEQWGGTGTALVDAATEVAVAAACRLLWVLTTNDNVDALRFYQRRGLRLSALRPGAVDLSRRTLKPQIPPTGNYGIPLSDEIELCRDLPARGEASPVR